MWHWALLVLLAVSFLDSKVNEARMKLLVLHLPLAAAGRSRMVSLRLPETIGLSSASPKRRLAFAYSGLFGKWSQQGSLRTASRRPQGSVTASLLRAAMRNPGPELRTAAPSPKKGTKTRPPLRRDQRAFCKETGYWKNECPDREETSKKPEDSQSKGRYQPEPAVQKLIDQATEQSDWERIATAKHQERRPQEQLHRNYN